MAEENKKPAEVKTENKKTEKPVKENKIEKSKDKKPVEKPIEKPADERTYVIPLREKCRPVPRYKKTNKAVKTIKEFLVRHMKIRDRDLRKIKLDSYLNEFLWSRGIRNPPHKVKVKAVQDGEIVKVELVELPKKLQDKKAREEKINRIAEEAGAKKKAVKPVEKPESKAHEEKVEEEEKKVEEKEKKASVVEQSKEIEKTEHKKSKHTAKKQSKSMASQRQNLAR